MLLTQVGDGTTTVVILAGEFLKAAKPFIEENVHPRVRRPELSARTQFRVLQSGQMVEHLPSGRSASQTRPRAPQFWAC